MTDSKQERYRREKKIGVGSLGEVWLATDLELDRRVVIKYLQTAHHYSHKEQFLRETRVLADLKHPNIVPIFDTVFADGEKGRYLVMEYCEGRTLSDIIAKSGPLPLITVFQVAIAILQALSQAHRHGIVHRDVKPANIMLKENANGDEVKLLDFGLAILKEDLELRSASLAYMAPEQIQGQPPDGRADLYSLGITLFEMIAGGQLPSDHAAGDKSLPADSRTSVLRLCDFSPSIPPVLEHAVMRMLAKDPEQRYPSADVLMNILDSIYASLRYDKPYLKLLEHNAPPLVGRNRELEQLETTWNQVQISGEPRLLVIHGDMGVGKTRLVAEFLDKQIADRGFVPLVGRCDKYGAPYAPFVEILATIFKNASLQSTSIAEEKAHVLLYVPGLARYLNTHPSAAPEAPQCTRWQFFKTMLTVLGQLGPTVLFLEDATHLDEASAALTRYLIQHGEDLRLLIIAACRDIGDSIPWLDAFRIDETEVLTLRPLSADAIRAHLIALMNGPVSDSVLRTVHTRSSGIPLYTDVIADLLIEEGEFYQAETGEWQYKPSMKTRPMSPTLMSLFAQRLGTLSQKSFKTLALAAVIDTEFDFDTWLTLLGGDSERSLALNVLDEALGMQILRVVGQDRYRFQPPDIAKVLEASLTGDRRRHLHPQIAQILSDQDAEPGLIAHHYGQAGLIEEAARYLETAGARATKADAVNQAIDYYDRAVALRPSPTRYEALGRLYCQKAAPTESIEAFTRGFEMARQGKDINAQARILNNLSLAHCRFGDFQDAHKSAIAVLELEGVSEIQQAVARSNLGTVCWHIGQLAEAEELCRSAVNVLEKDGHGTSLAMSYSWLGLALFARGKYPQAKAAHQNALEIYRNAHDYCGQAHCLNYLALVAIDQGDFKSAASLLDSAHALFNEIDNQDGLTVVRTTQGRALLRQGKAGEALPVLIEALELTRQTGASRSSSLYDIYLLIAEVNVDLGDLKWAVDALAPLENVENPQLLGRAQAIRARIYELQGDGAAAQEMYSAALATFEQLGNPSGLLRTKQHYARYLSAQGSAETAKALRNGTRDEAARIGLHL